MDQNKEVIDALRALIEATDRTTRAVRSLALFVIGYIPWLLAGAVFFSFGFVNPYDGGPYILIGAVILVVGSVVVIAQSLRELGLSRVPINSASGSTVASNVESQLQAMGRPAAENDWRCSSCGVANGKALNACNACGSFRS